MLVGLGEDRRNDPSKGVDVPSIPPLRSLFDGEMGGPIHRFDPDTDPALPIGVGSSWGAMVLLIQPRGMGVALDWETVDVDRVSLLFDWGGKGVHVKPNTTMEGTQETHEDNRPTEQMDRDSDEAYEEEGWDQEEDEDSEL